jgi:hypothetical protein
MRMDIYTARFESVVVRTINLFATSFVLAAPACFCATTEVPELTDHSDRTPSSEYRFRPSPSLLTTARSFIRVGSIGQYMLGGFNGVRGYQQYSDYGARTKVGKFYITSAAGFTARVPYPAFGFKSAPPQFSPLGVTHSETLPAMVLPCEMGHGNGPTNLGSAFDGRKPRTNLIAVETSCIISFRLVR